jgi:hypothetical protein
MAQFVVASFDTASAANAAAQDLDAAMIPSAVSRHHASGAVPPGSGRGYGMYGADSRGG